MITKKNQTKNRNIFETTIEKYGVFTDSLKEFLGDDLYKAPASTMLSLNNACEGGLVDHLINITKYSALINEMLPENIKQPKDSVVKVALLSEIGKTFKYKVCESEWHRKNQGKMYEFNEDEISMRVGERSAYYALKFGVKLSEVEYQALINFEKSEDDKQAKWHSTPLTIILKQAIELAIIDEKNRE